MDISQVPVAERNFIPELHFSASRSSGPGGQHVNKVSSRVELRFDIRASGLLSPDEKELILVTLAKRINNNGELLLVCQTERSQYENKEKVTERFFRLLVKSLTPQKKRTPTRPTRASRIKRVESKRKHAEKKKRRSDVLREE